MLLTNILFHRRLFWSMLLTNILFHDLCKVLTNPKIKKHVGRRMRSQQSEWLEVQKGLNAIMFQHDMFSLQYDICRESKKHGAFSNMTHALSYTYKIQWYYRSEIPEVLRALPTWRFCQDHRRSTYPPRKPCSALGRGFRWTKLCLETFFQISNYMTSPQPRFSEREGMWLLQIKYFSSLHF